MKRLLGPCGPRKAFFSMSDFSTSEPRHKVRLKMSEGARRLGCSQRHLYVLAYKGEIPTYKAAGHRWIDEEDIEAYIARCKAAGPNFGRAPARRKPGRPKGKVAKQPSSTAAE
jgi:excisionase family DNA binding protein